MADGYSKIILITLQIFAFWSVWRWYFLRLTTSNDEFYGILALVAVIGLCFRNRKNEFVNLDSRLIIASIFVYAASYAFLPPILRAMIAVTSLTLTVSGMFFARRFHIGVWLLFFLTLPLVASMQFYLGFPLRAVVGEITALMVKTNGFEVIREGVALNFGEQSIWIDAPCSGIKMLWMGLFLTALLIVIYRLNLLKSFVAIFAALGVILLGNVFRAVGLFYLEADIIKMPPHAHEAIGTSAFVVTCAGIALILSKLKRSNLFEHQDENYSGAKSLIFNSVEKGVFVFIVLIAFVIPFGDGGKTESRTMPAKTEFPLQFEGKILQNLGLSERERFFLNDFPGDIGRFSDGRREIIFRYVTEATRKLHSSSDCFSTIGYEIEPLPVKIDRENHQWSCFKASRKDEKLKVCERIYSADGQNWTDVSAWYWSALSRNIQGYWAVTVAENDLQNFTTHAENGL